MARLQRACVQRKVQSLHQQGVHITQHAPPSHGISMSHAVISDKMVYVECSQLDMVGDGGSSNAKPAKVPPTHMPAHLPGRYLPGRASARRRYGQSRRRRWAGRQSPPNP